MRVRELIQALEKFPPELVVLTDHARYMQPGEVRLIEGSEEDGDGSYSGPLDVLYVVSDDPTLHPR